MYLRLSFRALYAPHNATYFSCFKVLPVLCSLKIASLRFQHKAHTWWALFLCPPRSDLVISLPQSVLGQPSMAVYAFVRACTLYKIYPFRNTKQGYQMTTV